MRGAPALIVSIACLVAPLAGCLATRAPDPDPFPEPDPGGWTDPGGGSIDGCKQDSECSASQVCARTGDCLPASEVRAVHVTWTLRTMPASETSCANSPKLAIRFSMVGNFDSLGYSPVPCPNGKFTVDKLPRTFTHARLSLVDDPVDQPWTRFDDAGDAAIDLPF